MADAGSVNTFSASPTGCGGGRRHGTIAPVRKSRLYPRLSTLLSLALAALGPGPAWTAWADSELRPAARLIFPYYDVRPGTLTTLFLTNVGTSPVTVQITFYDQSCLRMGATTFLSAKDTAALSVLQFVGDGTTATFRQGFVDVVAGPNSLVGAATIVNVVEDWAVSYHAASAKRVSGPSPFEPFPARLALPGFFASAEGPRRLDGFLVLVAPNPTVAGGIVADEAVRAAFDVILPPSGSRSLTAAGHQLILPLSFFAPGASGSGAGWLTVSNAALDEEGKPLGMVGLFIQTLVDPAGGGMAGAVRLWDLR